MSAQENNLSFWEHLDALRVVIIKSLCAWIIGAICVFAMKKTVFHLLFAPSKSDFVLFRAIGRVAQHFNANFTTPDLSDIQFLNTELTAQFTTHIQVSLWGGLVISIPLIIYWLYGFISPALYEKEKHYSTIALSVSILLFTLGVLLNYFLIFPLSFRFLSGYEVYSEVHNQISLSSYISTFLILSLLMGLLFEIPVLTWFLNKIGILKAETLKYYRRHTFVAILIVAAVITPTGDPFTLLLVTLPVYLLYELSILIIRKNQS